MLVFPNDYFYRNPPKLKVKHILPKIGEVEDFDIEWEFQGEIGDVEALADVLGGGEKGRGGEGGRDGEGPDREKLIEEYEEYLRELENVKSKEKRVTQDLITVFVDLHRVASEFGEMLGNLTKTLANLVYTTSPTLGALGEGLGAFGREMQGLGKAVGGIHENLRKSVEDFRKAASALEMFQLRFPQGAPDLSRIQQGAQTAATAAQAAGRIGMVVRGLQGIAAAAGPASIFLLAFTQALAVFAQSLQILLPIVSTLLGILGNIFQVIERGTQVMSVIERWRLAFSQFVEGAAAGEQAFNRFMNMFSRFGTTLDELTRSLSNALGSIGIMAAQGRVSLEEWASLLGRIGQLGVRAGQQAEVLRAALEGRIHEAGGLGLPVETAESIAMLQYGIAGMGETATRTMVAMALLEMQIDNLRQQSARAAQGTRTAVDAIRAYNQIVGRLQEIYQDAGRIILEYVAEPLQVFARLIQTSQIREVLGGIAEAVGTFAQSFLEALAPFLERIANILQERMGFLIERARDIGWILGETLGVALETIVDFITNPWVLLAFQRFALFLSGLVETLSGIIRVLGPPTMEVLGLVVGVLGLVLKGFGLFLNGIVEITHWLGRLLRLFDRRRDRPQAEIPSQLGQFQQAMRELDRTLNNTATATLLVKRSFEAVSEEARKFADNYRRIQQVMQEVSILFTPQGLGATWAPFQEFFRTFRQTTFLPPEIRRGFEEAGVLERRGAGIAGIFARGQQPAIIRPEEELEFRIPRLQPIPVGFAEWAGVQIQAALREIDARMTHLAATLATFNQEMMRTGYTINTSVIQAYQQLAQAFRNLATQMENINRQTQEMIRGLKQAYEITETWLRLRWGLEDLRTAGAYLDNIVTASERLLTITRLRAEAQLIEVQRAAAVLGIITAMVRQQIASLRRSGVDIGIEPEQFDPLRMAPAQIAQIMQRAGMPYFLVNLTIQLTQGLQESWTTMVEVFRRGGEEIVSAASSFRELQREITEAAVRFGDMRRALQSGIWALISFGEELRGLGLKLAAALASNRIEEYYRALQEGWRRFVEMFERSIDVIRRGLEAAFQPLNIHLDILERATRILERFGAQGLLLPEIFTKVIPEASRLLRLLEEMAQQYREHPYMLQMIFQVYETELNRLMGLLGQAAGGLVPAIPLSELIRISQLPILSPRLVAQWAREGGPEVFAPEVRIMGAPFAPTYLLAWPVHMRGPTYLAVGPFGELARSAVEMGRLAAELETEEIRRQIGEIYRQFVLLPFERWRRRATQGEQFLREGLPLVIQQIYEQNILGARAGLMRERVPLPGFEGVTPYQPTLAIPPQAMEVPVRLRIQLDNNVIPLQIQIRKPDGGYETIEKRIEITPIDIARRNPPTTGTQ